MKDRLEVNTLDMGRLLAAADVNHLTPGIEGISESSLDAIRELVPCNVVAYNVFDRDRQEWVLGRDAGDGPQPEETDLKRLREVADRMLEHSLPCTYPTRTPHTRTVLRSTDFYPSLRAYWASSYGEWTKITGGWFAVLIPLTQTRSRDHRIVLFRDEGRDFSDRERLLLQVLRPHLLELELLGANRDRPLPLTQRQTEVLRLVADGLTNRQIGRHLGLSEGTVRTHLMHTFDLLGVQSRAAAVSLLAGDR